MRLLCIGLVVVGCSTTPRTEVIVVVDSDLTVPAVLDELRVSVTGADMRMESSMAILGDGQPSLPRTLGLVYRGGELGPIDVRVDGLVGGTLVVSRAARFSFVRKETLVLTMHLVDACRGVDCGASRTCTEDGCQSLDAGLSVWTGSPPRIGETLDAGVDAGRDAGGDACSPEICGNGVDDDCDIAVDETEDEICNGFDDDCDSEVDEAFDLATDLLNCGACGRQCVFRNGTGICTAGECRVTSCMTGFDDCDGDQVNGCETDLTASATHCGACGNECGAPTRVCCTSRCARTCP